MHSDGVGGGGGLFAYYPTTGALLRDCASEVEGRGSELGALRRHLDAEHRRMLASIDGELYEPLSSAPEVATANLVRVEQTTCFAAGVVRLFADAVDDYNHHATGPRSVDALNAAYTDARLTDFGLDPDTYTNGGANADRDYDSDRAGAEAEVRVSLTAEYQRLGEWLDLRAEQAARMLDRGPNPGDVTALWAAGALPPQAPDVWPHLDLFEVPMLRLPYELRDSPNDRRTLTDLTRDELLQLWNDHEFEPAREIVAEQIVVHYENGTGLREFNLSINVAYMTAMAHGMPESLARRLAKADPTTIFDMFAPIAAFGKLTYRMTIRDLVDAVKNDPWSLRTLSEVAMVTPVGRFGKLRKADDIVEGLDNARDAERAADAADEARAVVRIGGPKDFEPDDLRGMNPDDVRTSIPDNWSMRPSKSGDGEVYNDPAHRGRQIRIMPGYPSGSRPDPLTAGPYAVISQNGAPPVKVPLASNPTLGAR